MLTKITDGLFVDLSEIVIFDSSSCDKNPHGYFVLRDKSQFKLNGCKEREMFEAALESYVMEQQSAAPCTTF